MRLHSLSARINLAILITAVLLNIAAFLILYPLESARYDKQLARIELLLDTVFKLNHDDLANELFAGQTRALWATVREMQQIRELVGISLFAADGSEYLASNEKLRSIFPAADAPLPDQPVSSRLSHDGRQLIIYRHTIDVIGERIGSIAMFYDLTNLERDVRQSILFFALLSLVTLVIMVVLLNFFLIRSITRPVSTLRDAMRRVETGSLGETVDITGDNEITEMIGGFNDMSIRLAEGRSALQQAERKYRNIFENAVEGIFQATPGHGRFLTVNPAMASILGYDSPEELLTSITNIRSQLFIHRRDWVTMGRTLADLGKVVAVETQLRHKQGHAIWTAVSARQVTDQDGAVRYFEGTLVDTTERRNKEEAEQKRLAAELANQAKSEFLAKMSHEIRTPLNAILGFADILASSVPDQQQRSYIETIQTSGSNLLQLINDILDLSKIEAGRMELDPTPVKLTSLFRDLESVFSISVAQKKIKLVMSVDCTVPPLLLLDKTRLRQVLFNLIGNGVKFTRVGEVMVTARTEPSSDTDGVTLILTVKDTGVGIPPDQLDVIFGSFRQASGSSTHQVQGTGLGLAISKALVEMMHGTIAVDSIQGAGSSFTVALPDVAVTTLSEPDQRTAVNGEDPLLVFKPATILVADDLEMNRQLIKAALKHSPLTIIDASDGRQAVDKALRSVPDLVLLDIIMPDLGGHEAIAKLRQDTRTNAIPVVAITAGGMKEDIEKISKSGFDAYLIRPFNAFALQQVISRFLPFERIEQTNEGTSPQQAEDEAFCRKPWMCPPEIFTFLHERMNPRWQSIRRRQRMPEIQSFAEDLVDLAKRHDLPTLKKYAESLTDAVAAFDIERLSSALSLWNPLLNNARSGSIDLSPNSATRSPNAEYPGR